MQNGIHRKASARKLFKKSAPGLAAADPLAPKICLKQAIFSNFKGKTPILSKFWAQPPWVKTPLCPLTKILDPRLTGLGSSSVSLRFGPSDQTPWIRVWIEPTKKFPDLNSTWDPDIDFTTLAAQDVSQIGRKWREERVAVRSLFRSNLALSGVATESPVLGIWLGLCFDS